VKKQVEKRKRMTQTSKKTNKQTSKTIQKIQIKLNLFGWKSGQVDRMDSRSV